MLYLRQYLGLYIKVFHLYNERHLTNIHVPSLFNVLTALAEDGLLLDAEHSYTLDTGISDISRV